MQLITRVVEERKQHIGGALRAARLQWGLTQREVAVEAGITQGCLGRHERGMTRSIDADLVYALADVLRTTPSALWRAAETIVIVPRTPGRPLLFTEVADVL